MPFSHHSHSGQFCGHGQNRLEEVLQAAVAKKMDLFAMTEHMPRRDQDLYPEEIKIGETSDKLHALFKAYMQEATRLRTTYAGQIQIVVGMEIDWIRPSSLQDIQELLNTYHLEFFVGSVHHVHGIPTDYDRDMYLQARVRSGGTDERLFEDYFDLQYEMLKSLQPPIVGHFDVIRLWCDDANGSFSQYTGVWRRILRNLDYIAHYGGVMELNSAGLRKGMKEPYPQAEICKEFLKRNGTFTFSDDSHSVAQVATHYRQSFEFAERIGLSSVVRFKHMVSDDFDGTSRRSGLSRVDVLLDDLKTHPFFLS